MKTLEFFYDVGSPWTYLAFSKIEELAGEHEAVLAYRPILVGGVFNAPTSPGSQFGVNFQYSQGAAGYGAAPGQAWSILTPGTSIGIGTAVDGIFDVAGTEIELTTVWNVIAFYQHIWNARWRTSLFGGYVQVDYNGNATRIILSHLPGAAVDVRRRPHVGVDGRPGPRRIHQPSLKRRQGDPIT